MMNEKERMYQMAKAIAALKDALHFTETGVKNLDDSGDLLFEAHVFVVQALEKAEEALDCYLYMPGDDE